MDRLADALQPFPDIAFAVLFGSAASGRLRDDSDIDIAVYGASGRALEIESDRILADEAAIQIAAERATGRNVDLLVLNRAPATVCAAAMLANRPILIRDGALYSRYFLAVTRVAFDFLETERDFRAIRDRSASLSPIDRNRLERILDFVDDELQDRSTFADVQGGEYRRDRALRRNLDRWVETLTNATIDIAKIILASEHRPVPQTYGRILSDLEELPAFSRFTGRLAPLAPLRNVMAHEYLDLRFTRINNFVDTEVEVVAELATAVREWLR